MEISSASCRSNVQSLIEAICSTRSTGWDVRSGSNSIRDMQVRPRKGVGRPLGHGPALFGYAGGTIPPQRRRSNRPPVQTLHRAIDSGDAGGQADAILLWMMIATQGLTGG